MDSNVLQNTGRYTLSDNQKNLIRLGNQEVYYNQILIEFKEEVQKDNLINAISRIKQQQEEFSLKLEFDEKYNYPFQYQSDKKGIEFFETKTQENVSEELSEKLNGSFDPQKNDIFRFAAVNSKGRITHLMVRLYALWGDSFSCYSFCKELVETLTNPNQNKEENPNRIDYFNFSKWQNDLIAEPEEEATIFWNTIGAQQDRFSLPFAHGANANFNPKRIKVTTLEKEIYQKLHSYCDQNEVSVSDYIFTLYSAYLNSFSSGNFVIGYVPFKRIYEDLDDTFGLVNKYFRYSVI